MMWKEQYRLGVEEVDRQHKELFERLSSFISTVRDDEMEWEKKIPEIKETMSFMQEYVVEHFDSEEEFQQEIGYPGYEEHQEIHERFKSEVAGFADRFEKEGYDQELAQEFSGKLMAWLINHVTGDDQKIKDYLESEKSADSEKGEADSDES